MLFKKKHKFLYDVYLAGTCNNSKWRAELIPLLNKDVKYIDPTTDYWDHSLEMKMRNEKSKCKYILYTITSEMKGVLAIANVVDLAHKIPKRIIFCCLKEGFDQEQLASLEEVKYLLSEYNVQICDSLFSVANFINEECRKN